MNTTWNLHSMYADDADFQKQKAQAQKGIDEIIQLKEHALESMPQLLDTMSATMRQLEKLYAYAHMKRDEDSRLAQSQKMALEMDAMMSACSAASSFLEPLILSLSSEELKKLQSDPSLALYQRYLEKILRSKPHTLSEQEEYILAISQEMGGAAENAFYMLSYADMKFPQLEHAPSQEHLTHSNYVSMMQSPNQALRMEAFDKMYGTYDQYKNTFASTLLGAVKNAVLTAKMRHFSSARQLPLFADDVDLSVYDNLIDSVHSALPTMGDYMDFKKQRMGLEELHMYDIYAPFVPAPKETIPYEKAVEIIKAALLPLGDDYAKILDKAFEESWIDVYPREGKKSGAYSWGCYDSHPFILMNYEGTLDSVFTLAHELGHSLHSYYSRKSNPYIYSRYTIFSAEVASITNELLLLHYLQKKAASKDESLYLTNHYLDQFRATVFRQTMFAEFEREIHARVEKEEALTAQDFTHLYYQLNQQYFPGVTVEESIGLEWARIPHFYNNFYVYKYATGFCAASLLSKGLLENPEGSLERYLTFLKDGGNHYPIEQLKAAGADMTNPATVDQALQLFHREIDTLKKEHSPVKHEE